MASRGEAREHETRKDANNGTHRAGYAAPICFVTDLFRFGFVLFLPYFVPGGQIAAFKIAASLRSSQ